MTSITKKKVVNDCFLAIVITSDWEICFLEDFCTLDRVIFSFNILDLSHLQFNLFSVNVIDLHETDNIYACSITFDFILEATIIKYKTALPTVHSYYGNPL